MSKNALVTGAKGGISAFMTLPRAEDPVIINRYANITTSFPGASAERVETLVTEVIENKLRELSEVKLVSSTSRPSVSIVTLELNDTITEPEPRVICPIAVI